MEEMDKFKYLGAIISRAWERGKKLLIGYRKKGKYEGIGKDVEGEYCSSRNRKGVVGEGGDTNSSETLSLNIRRE